LLSATALMLVQSNAAAICPSSIAGRILVADDNPGVCRLLRRLLEPSGYEVEEVDTADAALDRIGTDPPDLVLLDLNLPGRGGYEVLEEIRGNPTTRLLPVVMLAGLATSEERIHAYREGATDFLAKPFSPEQLFPRVSSLVKLKQFADEHEHTERVILMLARMIDERDPYTSGHGGRVADCADRIAARMGFDQSCRSEIRRGALFHDLGKVVIPDAVLHKPGHLTPEEREVIQQHPTTGFELLSPLRTLRKALPIVHSHHERLDGSGYPEGISGDAISMPVRIVTIADVFDAVTSSRAYREALKPEIAFEILADGVAKGWWDREVLGELRAVVAESAIVR
jgi:putative two-component system response regulator